MVADGADLLDVGGASSRPGHAAVAPDEETARVVPVIRALAAALPGVADLHRHDEPRRRRGRRSTPAPTCSTTSGAWPRTRRWSRLAAERGVPIVADAQPRRGALHDLVAEVIADLPRALDRADGRRACRGTT